MRCRTEWLPWARRYATWSKFAIQAGQASIPVVFTLVPCLDRINYMEADYDNISGFVAFCRRVNNLKRSFRKLAVLTTQARTWRQLSGIAALSVLVMHSANNQWSGPFDALHLAVHLQFGNAVFGCLINCIGINFSAASRRFALIHLPIAMLHSESLAQP